MITESFNRQFLSSLPLIFPNELDRFSKYVNFIPLSTNAKQEHYYLIVDLLLDNIKHFKTSYYLMKASKADKTEYFLKIDSVTDINDISVKYMKNRLSSRKDLKRKIFNKDINIPFDTEFADILSDTQDRILFTLLSEELRKRGVHHSGPIIDDSGLNFALSINYFSSLPNVCQESLDLFNKDLTKCKFRVYQRGVNRWMIEIVFDKNFLKSISMGPNYHENSLQFSSDISTSTEKTVDVFLRDISGLAKLYGPAYKLYLAYKQSETWQNNIGIYSYDFRQLKVTYGPSKTFVACFKCSTDGIFKLKLGCLGIAHENNPHTLAVTHFQKILNESGDLVEVTQLLLDTSEMYSLVSKLNSFLRLTAANIKPSITFTALVQTVNRIHLIYKYTFVLELLSAPKEQGIYVKDATLHNKLSPSFRSIPYLTNFLQKVSNNSYGRSNQQILMQNDDGFFNDILRMNDYEMQPISFDEQTQSDGLSKCLSYKTFKRLVTAVPVSSYNSQTLPCSPLERFLASIDQRNKISCVLKEKSQKGFLSQIQAPDNLSHLFRNENVTFKIYLEEETMQSLKLEVLPTDDMQDLTPDDIKILTEFFSSRVVAPPHNTNAITSFMSLLCTPIVILKDFIQLIKFEFYPEIRYLFKYKFLLTFPVIEAPLVTTPGVPTFWKDRLKCMFMLEFKPEPEDPKYFSFVLAFVYEFQSFKLSLLPIDSRNKPQNTIRPELQNIYEQIKRHLERVNMAPPTQGNGYLINYIRDIMNNIKFDQAP